MQRHAAAAHRTRTPRKELHELGEYHLQDNCKVIAYDCSRENH